MIFTSGTQALQGRIVNHDPEPWVMDGGNSANRRWPAPTAGRGWWDYRDEYEVTDNPILADFRASNGLRPLAEWVEALGRFTPEPAGTGHRIEPNHVDHARKVLTRLAQWKDDK